ncbi:phage minor head protein [Helicobacter baculiformis]|uniref:Phage minor head protein n=1 Tax=Helicobacter baculiformis TaxID=427351 RepID=A0ABV7ZLN7_9HELI
MKPFASPHAGEKFASPLARLKLANGANHTDLPRLAPPIAESEDGDGWYYLFESEQDHAARHKAYHGTCLPRNHPFWKTHTPPLDWGCRCRLSMHSKDEPTSAECAKPFASNSVESKPTAC